MSLLKDGLRYTFWCGDVKYRRVVPVCGELARGLGRLLIFWALVVAKGPGLLQFLWGVLFTVPVSTPLTCIIIIEHRLHTTHGGHLVARVELVVVLVNIPDTRWCFTALFYFWH